MWSVVMTASSGETHLLFSFSGNFCREIDKALTCWGFPGGTCGIESACNAVAAGETWVRSLGREDLLEEGMAAHSSVLAWRIPWTEESNGLWSIRSQRVRNY